MSNRSSSRSSSNTSGKTQKRKRSSSADKANHANTMEVEEGNTGLTKTKQINPCNTKKKSDLKKLTKYLSENNIEAGKKDLFNCIIMNNSYVDYCKIAY